MRGSERFLFDRLKPRKECVLYYYKFIQGLFAHLIPKKPTRKGRLENSSIQRLMDHDHGLIAFNFLPIRNERAFVVVSVAGSLIFFRIWDVSQSVTHLRKIWKSSFILLHGISQLRMVNERFECRMRSHLRAKMLHNEAHVADGPRSIFCGDQFPIVLMRSLKIAKVEKPKRMIKLTHCFPQTG